MTDAEINLLKNSIDKNVEIRTVEGEILVAKVNTVIHWDEHEEHEITYRVVSSNMMAWYERHGKDEYYVLDFERIVSVKPADR